MDCQHWSSPGKVLEELHVTYAWSYLPLPPSLYTHKQKKQIPTIISLSQPIFCLLRFSFNSFFASRLSRFSSGVSSAFLSCLSSSLFLLSFSRSLLRSSFRLLRSEGDFERDREREREREEEEERDRERE